MAFTQQARVWWDTTKPGADTTKLFDADIATTPPASADSGIEGWHRGRLFVCERSSFVVPLREVVTDPNNGRRVWRRFVNKPAPDTGLIDSLRPPIQNQLTDRADDLGRTD